MLFGLQGSKIAVILPVIVISVLLLLIFGINTKSNFILKKNKELSEEISRLTAKLSALTEKLNVDMSELARKKEELEKTRNKLTQERLKNRQLLQKKEELEGAVSINSISGESEPS